MPKKSRVHGRRIKAVLNQLAALSLTWGNSSAAGLIKKEPDLRGRAGTRRQAVGLTKNNGGEIEESLFSTAYDAPEHKAKAFTILRFRD
jgi:hypothetical protein